MIPKLQPPSELPHHPQPQHLPPPLATPLPLLVSLNLPEPLCTLPSLTNRYWGQMVNSTWKNSTDDIKTSYVWYVGQEATGQVTALLHDKVKMQNSSQARRQRALQ